MSSCRATDAYVGEVDHSKCLEAGRRIDAELFDDDAKPPDWCPLREGPITLRLRK